MQAAFCTTKTLSWDRPETNLYQRTPNDDASSLYVTKPTVRKPFMCRCKWEGIRLHKTGRLFVFENIYYLIWQTHHLEAYLFLW